MSLPDVEYRGNIWQRTFDFLSRYLNFYRIHIIFFTFTPLIFSGIFYASNGANHIAYIDALFNCVSAMTVCGLATVDLSGLTAWQQVLLFIQMGTDGRRRWSSRGSWYTQGGTIHSKLAPGTQSDLCLPHGARDDRRRVFTVRCENLVRAAARKVAQNSPGEEVEAPASWASRFTTFMRRGSALTTIQEKNEDDVPGSLSRGTTVKDKKGANGEARRLRPDMIRRMDDAPKLVNPSGWISEGRSDPLKVVAVEPKENDNPESQEHTRQLAFADEVKKAPESEESSGQSTGEERMSVRKTRRLSDPGTRSRRPSPAARDYAFQKFPTFNDASISRPPSPPERPSAIPRTQTIEFALSPRGHPTRPDRGRYSSYQPDTNFRRGPMETVESDRPGSARASAQFPYSGTYQSARSQPARHSESGTFGGFPWPHEIASRLMDRFFPRLRRQLSRTVTMPRTMTLASQYAPSSTGARMVPYISFDAVVGRNSAFHSLTNDQLEELGGIEYRALSALLWIVAGYHILTQLAALTVIGPYIAASAKWKAVLKTPMQHRDISPGWFSFFQVVSAYTNTGTSLCDESMVPFQKAYPMILFMIFLILAGNTAFPIFLRFYIWIISKCVPTRSRLHETLRFLLDHPRRCFIYLFPSHQTWFLFTILIMLNGTDWVSFLVLDIGTPTIEQLPTGVRVIDGLLQAAAVRAAGFATVSLSALAPAVKVLYVIMMYISVYPIAMSVRSTNVYEEKSLGIYDDEDGEDAGEDKFSTSGGRITVWSRYLAMHARKQLAFDMWWLCLALLLVCIVERGNINNPNNFSWFTIFNIIFELVSAYGTVGLSLGVPYANYSFSGAFSPLSKLIVCIVMLRGRHRGLPVAIDRAVILPFEYRNQDDDHSPSTFRRRRTGSMRFPTTTSNATNGNAGAGVSTSTPITEHPTRRRSSLWTKSQHENDDPLTSQHPSPFPSTVHDPRHLDTLTS
ncbi:hypothetical protein EVG20_g8425 [Dentipellis fragilis]|uniref:Potassium transport protein n=1 Tax=Dentipellis fragilis TaxID=205917 RepID=A0A4Y9Y5G5_9AGAM|nr:hypothetical protein EVG20_g8425 [Dentipellis fragilis]